MLHLLQITVIVGYTSYATKIFYKDNPNNLRFIDLAEAFYSWASQFSLIVFELLNADEFEDSEEVEMSDSSCSSYSSRSEDSSLELLPDYYSYLIFFPYSANSYLCYF